MRPAVADGPHLSFSSALDLLSLQVTVSFGSKTQHVARANYALDAANFFLADVRDALGPYLAVCICWRQGGTEEHATFRTPPVPRCPAGLLRAASGRESGHQ
jgi:hypothetical protein